MAKRKGTSTSAAKRVNKAAERASEILLTKKTKFTTVGSLKNISSKTLKKTVAKGPAFVQNLSKAKGLRNFGPVVTAIRSAELAHLTLRKRGSKPRKFK